VGEKLKEQKVVDRRAKVEKDGLAMTSQE
jgi:hypothetical protein